MPKYLVEAKYTLDGIKGLKQQGGSARVAAAKALVEEMGGSLDSFHFAFGGADATWSPTCPTMSRRQPSG